MTLQSVAEGLTAPVGLHESPDGSERLFIVDQIGVIRIVTADGELRGAPFLDLRSSLVDLKQGYDERGLLALAFHPRFADNGRFFVYYSAPLREGAPEEYDHTSRLSELTVSQADPNRAERSSERTILELDQPQSNHNGGTLAFGPEDGFLYISLGDGGGANDVGLGHTPRLGNGQDVTNLYGSILRIDVDGKRPYAIPEDNPLVGEKGRDEIYAYGFRNPYRMSFDQGGKGELFTGDVGQDRYEEIDRVVAGGNYGWHIREGRHCFDPTQPDEPPADCPGTGPRGQALIPPVVEYLNANAEGGLGLAVIGGHVYRGDDLPDLVGEYVFGDYSASAGEPGARLFAAAPARNGSDRWNMRTIEVMSQADPVLAGFLLGLGQDLDGELYALVTGRSGPSGDTGAVYRLAP